MKIKIIDYIHHSYGHIGIYKVNKLISEIFYIKNLNKSIQERLKTCDLCQRLKPLNVKYNVNYFPITAKAKLEKVFCDMVGPIPKAKGRFGHQYILIIVDCFTKYTEVYSMHRATTKNILKCITQDYIKTIGKPQRIISDYATQFQSTLWKEILSSLNIKTNTISLYHPCSNMSERYIRQIKQFLTAYAHANQRNWIKYLKQAEDQVNNTHSETTGQIPSEVMLNKRTTKVTDGIIQYPEPKEQINIEERNEKIREQVETTANKRIQKQLDKNLKTNNIQPGDLVLVRTHHLANKMGFRTQSMLKLEGPYTVVEQMGKNAFAILHKNEKNKNI